MQKTHTGNVSIAIVQAQHNAIFLSTAAGNALQPGSKTTVLELSQGGTSGNRATKFLDPNGIQFRRPLLLPGFSVFGDGTLLLPGVVAFFMFRHPVPELF
jgi:hypothetical protein